ncbi:extracellular solute-binding protein [Anaerococcus obesiensis]|uniref:Extracellular solute-binding protein n=1 Tax=Anaerococcus obesiensis TaxID=1287640 RepID=A0A7T7USA8_9FIRM|nr:MULTISPECIES: substrate-binding domain-containing protein [Anaerococcus]MDU0945311.1 substrate-binding domain-containing protein [Anaerococcus vaginalis]MDU1029980.1 substrate-binding domain-containing protein [Anaerococcus vaginalis]QQN55306.1 extracellular solute-binding protein [Anaerococcus obesiensis]
MKIKKLNLLALALLFGLTGCGKNTEEIKTDSNVNSTSNEVVESSNENTSEEKIVKLTTTTSVNDSGLMDYLRDDFKKDTGLDMEIVSKGTGAAIEDAKAGNADVILVHSKDAEEKFIEEGYGLERKSFMHNFFVIVGPKDDPAGIKGKDAEEAFKLISEKDEKFVSRGDESGTHNKELKIWEKAGVDVDELSKKDNYNSLGDGMGATLTFASENNAYTLTDLSTFLTMENDLDLEVLVDQSDALKNVYSIIIVNPDKVKGTNPDVAKKFQDWMLSDKAKKLISEYGKEEYGQQLFFLGE